jgi:hypothetical protein
MSPSADGSPVQYLSHSLPSLATLALLLVLMTGTVSAAISLPVPHTGTLVFGTAGPGPVNLPGDSMNATAFVHTTEKNAGYSSHLFQSPGNDTRRTAATLFIKKNGTGSSPVRVPQPATGSLIVRSSPAGAEIILDGSGRGSTPPNLSGISAGSHVLLLRKAGYNRYSAVIMVAAGKTVTASITLEKAALRALSGTGSVYIDSTPPGAAIYIDGTRADTTPAVVTGLTEGTHAVVLKKDGFSDYSTGISVSEGSTESLAVDLVRE